MAHLALLLDEVMSNHPLNQTQGEDAPPCSQGMRRTRSQAEFDEGGRDTVATDQNTELSELTRRKLAFAESSMDHHGLEGPSRDIVCWFVTINCEYRDIEQFIVFTAQAKSRNRGSTAAMDFYHSQAFVGHVNLLLHILVLVPHTMFYVTPLQEWAVNHMRDHPTIWKIPEEVLEHGDQFTHLSSLVWTRLTTIRSQIKAKLLVARSKELDINQVMYMIGPKAAAILEAHRARWAWVSLLLDDFGIAVEAGKYQKEEFWSFIEHQLAATKKAIWASPQYKTNDQRYNKFVQVFMAALYKHNLLYPTHAKAGRPGIWPAWQAVLEESMGMGRQIYATMQSDAVRKEAEEEEEEEEEEGEEERGSD